LTAPDPFFNHRETTIMSITSLVLSRALARLPSEQHDNVSRRFHARGGFLQDRLARLYAHRADFTPWFHQLIDAMANVHAARSAELRELDARRESNPGWFTSQSMLGYAAYVDRFAGTLDGIADRIPHLQELGVTYLHLLPFLKARAGDNDGGFAVSDYDAIEPKLGSMKDLESLTAQLRRAGISLCSDFVLNHVADDHPWAMGAAQGDARLKNFFHVFPDRTVPDRFEQTLVNIFPQAAPGNFTWSDALQGWIWTTFYPYQWDLNYANPEVFAEMALALLRLANRGIEIFRLDSTAFLWKREGTNGMNQPEAHWILQALRCIVEIFAPAVILKAEAIVPTRELPNYFGSPNDDGAGHECHLAYHSSLMSAAWVGLATQDTSVLRQVIKGTPRLSPPASWITYVRCHDDIGWAVLRPELAQLGLSDDVLVRAARFLEGGEPGSFARGVAFQTGDAVAVHGTNGMAASLVGFENATTPEDIEMACRRLLLMYSVAFCFGGLPVVYMGDEIALTNDGSEAWQAAGVLDTRWAQRPFLPAQAFADRHDAATVSGQVFAHFRQLAGLRRKHAGLAAGVLAQLVDVDDASLLVLKRGDAFHLVVNFSGETKRLQCKQLGIDSGRGGIVDCLGENPIGEDIEVEPWQALWMVQSG
jgi:amylosucrase